MNVRTYHVEHERTYHVDNEINKINKWHRNWCCRCIVTCRMVNRSFYSFVHMYIYAICRISSWLLSVDRILEAGWNPWVTALIRMVLGSGVVGYVRNWIGLPPRKTLPTGFDREIRRFRVSPSWRSCSSASVRFSFVFTHTILFVWVTVSTDTW